MFLSHVLDELVGLALRINHERVSSALIDDDTILDRRIVLWQSSNVPGLYFHWHSQKLAHRDTLRVLDLQFNQMLGPLLFQCLPIARDEGSTIGKHGS